MKSPYRERLAGLLRKTMSPAARVSVSLGVIAVVWLLPLDLHRGSWLWADESGAPQLDLSGFVLSFEDRFHEADVVAHGPFPAGSPAPRWIAHTPWNGDFGDARFEDPSASGPFRFTPDGLEITAERDQSGHWRSGLIASVDRDGAGQEGFSQKYGYFEMRAKFPEGPGTWPAFWLSGVDKSVSGSEIDVIEYYGTFPNAFHSGQHVWNKQNPWAIDHVTHVPPNQLTTQFNTFGVLIGPERTRFYLNRSVIWDTPTRPEYQQPMYILANLAIGGGWSTTGLASPSIMQIDYIRVYQQKEFLKP